VSETLTAIACCAPLATSALSDDEAAGTAELFRALGDPHRVRIVNLLSAGGRMTGDELIEPLGLSQPTVSHHLKKLAEAGLLDREPSGQRAFFSLNHDALRELAAVADLRGVCC
jgi:ArsR family transcriptional regulator